jgi:hypothetical protein
MKKDIFIVTKHTYWEHYGSKPSKYECESKEEALAVANKYESDFFMEDGYYAIVHKESRIIITPEEEAKRLARQELRKIFDWKKDSFDYGIFTFWDGSKELFFINAEEGTHYIYFLKGKEKYPLKNFPVGDGESIRMFKNLWLDL